MNTPQLLILSFTYHFALELEDGSREVFQLRTDADARKAELEADGKTAKLLQC